MTQFEIAVARYLASNPNFGKEKKNNEKRNSNMGKG